MKNNKIVIDINKVQYAWRSWETRSGYKRKEKPTKPTVHGQEFDCDAPAYAGLLTGIVRTMLERAVSLGILDTWTPCTTFEFAANHRVIFTGDKAEVMWKAWNEKIFNKKK